MNLNFLRLYIFVTSAFLTFMSCKHRESFSATAATSKPVFDQRSLYLQGAKDFQGGVHLLHRDNIYHNTSMVAGKLNLERIRVTKIGVGMVHYNLFDQQDHEERKADLSTLYIPKEKTWRGKESEQVVKFLELCAKQDSAIKTCKLQSEAIAENTTKVPEQVVIDNFDGSLTLDRTTSFKGMWLLDMGLGYEIVEGTAYRSANRIEISNDIAVYSVLPKNIIGYFVTQTNKLTNLKKAPKSSLNVDSVNVTKGECLQGKIDFTSGTYLIGKRGLLYNSRQGTFAPQPITVLAPLDEQKNFGSHITIQTASGDTKTVNLSSLYIPRASTSIDAPEAVILEFLTQCEELCFLKGEAYDKLSENEKNTVPAKPQLFTKLALGVYRKLGLNGIWLVNMGMGYEIIRGLSKQLNGFLNITNSDSRVYNVKQEQLLGYSIRTDQK